MKHDSLFKKNPIRFRNFEECQTTLSRLTNLMARFNKSGDKAGQARVMHEARKGLRRANMISKNSRVGAQKREEKKEIALWFEVWLIAPEAFELWLRMRKARLQTGDSGPVV